MQSNPAPLHSPVPRVLIAGLRGSGGKSLVSIGLTATARARGYRVVPFKKGPDYIDAAWLARAADRPCRNLDLYMMDEERMIRSFDRFAPAGDIAVVEGNRGLYDGMDAEGTFSTGELAKLLQIPVVIVCDVTKTTRTLGAMVLGCQRFDPAVPIAGIILNRIAGQRHEALLRTVIEQYCELPVLGAIPKLPASYFPERHLGLVPPQEHGEVPGAIRHAAQAAAEHLDIEALLAIARSAPQRPVLSDAGVHAIPDSQTGVAGDVRIGVFRDEAFQFYYPENLEALEQAGGQLLFSSPLRDRALPDLDAIYIGGGFPETLAEQLAANGEFRNAVANAVEAGVPVYAECAGAVYLGRSLAFGDSTYPMTGALPVEFGFGLKPQGHGYTEAEVVGGNPFYPEGTMFRGHEFHYSHVVALEEDRVSFAFKMKRGHGVDGNRDGICYKNVLATYCHIHALGVHEWARSLVAAGSRYKNSPPQ
jgi:cobyrinic acid a,c-diamide synthase